MTSEGKVGQIWWHMLLIPAFKKQREVDLCEFKIGLGYIVRPCKKEEKVVAAVTKAGLEM